MTLTQLALAFVARHPAVTAAIIGPRTMEQLRSLLAARGRGLDDEVLDRIDEIVPPGVTINEADAGWQPPTLTDATSAVARFPTARLADSGFNGPLTAQRGDGGGCGSARGEKRCS